MTLESLDQRFDTSIDYLTESISDIPKDIGIFLKRCTMLLDNYVRGVRDILSEKYKQEEIKWYLQVLHKHRTYLNNVPILHKYTKIMVTKDPEYLDVITLSIARLMRQEIKYPQMVQYVNGYLEDTLADNSVLVEVDYDTLYNEAMDLIDRSNKRIEKILICMKHFSAMWKYTKTEEFSQTLIAGLFKMAKSACRQIAITSMYNLNAFKINFCDMVTTAITEEEHKSVQKFDKLSDKKVIALEAKSKVIATYKFGDATLIVHELPVEMAGAYNREGYNIYVDQSFAKYPPAVQKAVIYHEIGHLANGHFGTIDAKNDAVDARRLAHQVKKYKRMLRHSPFKEDIGDDELVYIMVESEADRYAAKYVGKKTIDNSIKIRMNRKLAADVPKDIDHLTDQETLLIEYNKERNRFRAALG